MTTHILMVVFIGRFHSDECFLKVRTQDLIWMDRCSNHCIKFLPADRTVCPEYRYASFGSVCVCIHTCMCIQQEPGPGNVWGVADKIAVVVIYFRLLRVETEADSVSLSHLPSLPWFPLLSHGTIFGQVDASSGWAREWNLGEVLGKNIWLVV